MRPLTCKQVAEALGIAETKATQAMQPALFKVAACLLMFPAETWAELNECMAALIRQREHSPSPLSSTDGYAKKIT